MADIPVYNLSVKEVFKKLKSNKYGLEEKEVEERLKKQGYNELKTKKGIQPFQIFLSQFKSFLILILMMATLIAAVIGNIIDAIIILIIILLNASFGFAQEYKAEKTLESLKKMSAPHAIVIRNGKEKRINARELVVGDVITLETGDQVPADARVFESVVLKAGESSLTGESIPVEKFIESLKRSVQIGERKNMVFLGTNIIFGRGKAIVTQTGMNTEFGKIAGLIQRIEERKTPLQHKLEVFGKWLAFFIILISIFVTLLGIMQGFDELEMFIIGISLAVAAIPEGLPAIVTITLALGIQKLAKKNAIIRKLSAVETLGSTTIICSDKTGTLTKNEMNVKEICIDRTCMVEVLGGYEKGSMLLGGKGVDLRKMPSLEMLLRIGVLCNDAEFQDHEMFGDPTEGALLIAARKAGINIRKMREKYRTVFEIPFDSNRKRMTTINKIGKRNYAYTKGAPESILKICDRIYEKGKIKKMTKSYRKQILEENERMAENALRVLGFCFKEVPKKKKYSKSKVEKEMIFVGIVGMIDPPRPEVKEAIKRCRNAGIEVKMVTGDYKITALAIAKEIGLLEDSKGVITGEEIERMSDDKLEKIVESITVFARVSPEHKLRVVWALSKRGHVVAVTGDGVNDAPALKKADIGIAMGISGTDVSKEASDMILSDDNFATIVSAIEGGRNVYDNIKQFVRYLLSCNAGEVMTMLAAAFFLPILPLTAIQILWMNLVTDGLPALALGVDLPEKDIMKRKPRKKGEGVVTKEMGFMILFTGIIMAALTLFIFSYMIPLGEAKATTIGFTTLMMMQMAIVFNSKSEKSVLNKKEFFGNRFLFLAIGISILLQLLVIYVPFLNPIFGTIPLGLFDWLGIIAAGIVVFSILELVKIIRLKSL